MTISNTFVFNPNQQYLFKRSYSVSLGPPNQTSAVAYGTIGKNPSPLRVRFDIDKNMCGSSNKSKIEIFNLSTESRQAIKKGYLLQLQAGYNGLVENLFVGNVITPTSTRNGADIITSLECGDGESSIIFAKLDKSYPAGVTLATILSDIAKAMGTTTSSNPAGVSAGIALGIPNVTYNKGFVAHGSCKDTLDKLVKPVGLEWTVQNGNLNIIPISLFDGKTAVLLSSETGMIGVPSQNQFFTQFTSLLNPKLVPGALVQLKSENTSLNGFYKIRRAHYEGDSHDTKWQVSCEAITQSNVVQNQLPAKGFDYTTAVV